MIDDPVEILVKMAENGDIDPWNIDIIEVTDRFFAEMEKQQTLDLRVSARTLLYASTLLRIKSEYLNQPDLEQDDELLSEGYGDDVEDHGINRSFGNPVMMLEHEIKRRLERKNMRKQPITLYDLITILRNAEKEERRGQRDGWVQDIQVYTEDIVSIAHEEAFHQSAIDVLTAYRDFSSCAEGGRMALSDLAKRLKWPLIQTFIPLLFLMQEGYLGIFQDTFFEEVYIVPLSDGNAVVVGSSFSSAQ